MAPDASSQSPVLVRELRWNDLHDLSDGYFRLYDEREEGVPIGITLFASRPDHEGQVNWFTGLYRRVLAGEAVCRIAEVDGRAVGSCTVTRVGSTPDHELGHLGELGILVHRDYRDRGVGAALLRETIGACRGKFDLVRLSVFTNNARAIALYRRFGFRSYGREPAAIRRGGTYIDLDLMSLDLRDAPAKG
jgi:L-phenylalanine/L-methionine N-acetyltransferase